MTTPSPTDPAWTLLTIAAVERETGIGKDTLRAWERRYGFPAPARDSHGDRAYTWSQVERLRRVHRLIAAGHRPGALMRLTTEQLDRLSRSEALATLPAEASAPPAGSSAPLLSLDEALIVVRSGGSPALRRWLMHALSQVGLARFVAEGAAPFATAVGEGWLLGRLQVFEEHLLSEALQTVLRHALLPLQAASADARPRILLATVPGEEHGLGLLMAEAMLTLAGASCTALGTATPLGDLVAAATSQRADIVALSFTARLSAPRRIASLRDLRARLPEAVALWAGGAGMAREHGESPGGWRAMDLAAIGAALSEWRETVLAGA